MKKFETTISFRLPVGLREDLEKIRGEKKVSVILRELITGLIKQNRQS